MARSGGRFEVTSALLGGFLLLFGALVTSVVVTDPPAERQELLAAGAVAFAALTSGAAFGVSAVRRQGAVLRRVARWGGWVPGVALAPVGLLAVLEPEGTAEQSSRIGSPADAIVMGSMVLGVCALFLVSWVWTLRRAAAADKAEDVDR